MSDFDPSLLQGKDKNELVAIATSLGQKPPSRAKKADIISLIMELVGADIAEDGGSGGDSAKADDTAKRDDAATDSEATKPASEDREPANRGGSPKSDTGGGRGGGRRGGKAPGGRDDDGDGTTGGRGDTEPNGAKKNGGRNGAETKDGSDDTKGDGNRGRGGRGGDQPEPGNRAEPAPQVDDGDGNRRRRRRGRDRQRTQEEQQQQQAEPVDVEGIVDLRDEGYGFLRVDGYLPHPDDAYISVRQVRQFGLRKGDRLTGKSRAANRNEKNPALVQIETLNGLGAGDPNAIPDRPEFDDLTPIYPDEHLRLEQEEFPENLTARVIDLLAPIGKGQRGLIVSPPKAGKTTVVKDIVRAIERNHPDVHVIVLLVDERPEEVTDLRRWMMNGEVAASTFDRPVEEHIAVADLVIERAKRLAESGTDVVVVLDGITRLARAHNLAAPANGRTMAGGMDASALYPPKKLFGAARNIEEGGSLTILATALVETNTRLDEVIFEEFKGTGNMELRLDRELAERRIFPAVDVDGSSTRHEELLHDRKRLAQIHRLRRMLSELKAQSGSGVSGIEMLVERLRELRTNTEFLDDIASRTTS